MATRADRTHVFRAGVRRCGCHATSAAACRVDGGRACINTRKCGRKSACGRSGRKCVRSLFAWWVWAIAADRRADLRQLGLGHRHGPDGGVRVPHLAARSAAARRPRSRVLGRRRRVSDHDGGLDRNSVLRRQRDRDSEQRRRVLSGDVERDRTGAVLCDDRGVYLLGRRHRAAVRRSAGRTREGRYLREDPARCRRLFDDRRRDSGNRSRKADASSRGTTRRGPYSIGRFNHRTHRKSLIIDGRIAFTGGAGIADHWMGNAQDDQHWRDIQIRMEGPAVVPLQTGFAQNWLQTTEEVVTGFEFYPVLDKPAGKLAVQTILSSPETGASTARTFYYLSIAAARRSIFIANPYFVPDQGAIDLLVAAKGRGRRRAHHGGGHSQRQLDGAAEQRAALRSVSQSGHRDLRVQPHDAAPEDDGRRRRMGDRRHDQLRQPLVRA